jgi:DnaK suppressor protein
MESNDLDQFKKALIQWLDNLSRNSDETIVRLSSDHDNFPDHVDRASQQLEMDFALTKLSRNGLSKGNILRALQKIEKRIYGICEECEEEIPINRLRAIPDTSYCLACQMDLEEERKMLRV